MRLHITSTIAALTFCWAPAVQAGLDIFVSVAPLKYFVETVGGGHVRVESVVQPGHSPITYEPTPRQMAALSAADAYVRVGIPFETTWMQRIRQANPGLEIIDARSGVELRPMDAAHEGQAGVGHDHAGADPHIWLDPALAGVIVRTIRDYLMRIDPAHGDDYSDNASGLLQRLAELDAEIRDLVGAGGNRKFLVFHPAWGYFARAYGLQQLAVEHEGKEPGPHSLVELVELVEREGIDTVFVQRQVSSGVAKTLAKEIRGRVVELDPLAEDYFQNLREAARAISNQSNADP